MEGCFHCFFCGGGKRPRYSRLVDRDTSFIKNSTTTHVFFFFLPLVVGVVVLLMDYYKGRFG